MTNKTGIVMEIKNKKACIMTADGEFAEVKIAGDSPSIGSSYTGITVTKIPFFKYASAVACLLLFTSIGGVAYGYYKPITSIVLDLNPSLELKANKWNRIIKTLPLNNDGEKLLASLNVKNKSIDEALSMILNEAENEHFIDTKKDKVSQMISLNITSLGDSSINISNLNKFKSAVKEKNLDVKVTYNKNGNTNIPKTDIIEDNEDRVNNTNKNSNINSKGNITNPNSSIPEIKKNENNSKHNSSTDIKQDNSSKNDKGSSKTNNSKANSNKNNKSNSNNKTLNNDKSKEEKSKETGKPNNGNPVSRGSNMNLNSGKKNVENSNGGYKTK